MHMWNMLLPLGNHCHWCNWYDGEEMQEKAQSIM